MIIFWRKWLNFWVGLILRIMTAGKVRADSRQMRQLDFRTSTRITGIRFTENLRNLWRKKWIRIKR